MGGKINQTSREKRLQSRIERTEKAQASEGTPKAASAKLKEKAPSAKRAKTVPTASTGSQKPATTGISTGSLKKGQQKEKLAGILARKAAVVLATLSTSPKQKEKQKREPSLYFKARRSVRIKTGRPQPPSKEPITIVDTPTTPKEESPSRMSITYE